MVSKLLQGLGIQMFLAGSSYNFRTGQLGPEAVSQQVERVRRAGGFADQVIYSLQQVHGTQVAYADGSNGDEGPIGRQFQEADGLLTDRKGIVLMTKFADCTPVVLYDPVQGVLASLHSGWRGTAQEISKRAIEKMQHQFGSRVEDLYAYIGPSIDQAHYEVGEEVYQAFAGHPQVDHFMAPGQKEGKYQLSMTQANLAVLDDAGLPSRRIEVATESTYTSDQLHSSRQEGPNYQLNALFVMMK